MINKIPRGTVRLAFFVVDVFTGLADYQVWIAAVVMVLFFALSIKGGQQHVQAAYRDRQYNRPPRVCDAEAHHDEDARTAAVVMVLFFALSIKGTKALATAASIMFSLEIC